MAQQYRVVGNIRKTSTIPHAPTGRILMAAGAKRVSADAMDAFSEVLHNYGIKVAKRAAEIAAHSGRKTIHEGDIKLAAQQ